MKPLLIVIIPLLTACQVTEVTRELPGGGVEKVTSKGLTAPARGVVLGGVILAGDIARARAGVQAREVQPNPGK